MDLQQVSGQTGLPTASPSNQDVVFLKSTRVWGFSRKTGLELNLPKTGRSKNLKGLCPTPTPTNSDVELSFQGSSGVKVKTVKVLDASSSSSSAELPVSTAFSENPICAEGSLGAFMQSEEEDAGDQGVSASAISSNHSPSRSQTQNEGISVAMIQKVVMVILCIAMFQISR